MSRSGPVKRLSIRDVPLKIDAALATRRTFFGLLGFSTGWVGRYQMCSG